VTVRGQIFSDLSLSISLQSSLRFFFFGQRIMYIHIYYFSIETHELENVCASLDDVHALSAKSPCR
jgi:hypothetical protein